VCAETRINACHMASSKRASFPVEGINNRENALRCVQATLVIYCFFSVVLIK
jgi:hypothetical protein